MATRPTSLELKQLNARTNQLQAQHDPGVFRLFRFLEAVWDYTKGVPCPEQTIYDLYCGKLPAREPNERAPAAALLNPVKAEFFAKAQRLHKACNGDTPLIPEDVVSVKNSNLEFRSPCHLAAITDRVYINVRMDHAVAVMRFIALEVVLGDRPCAVYAKIADPLELCVPLFDRIVIYCSSQAAAKLAARQVSGAFPDTCFNPGTPAMTEVLSPGICTGAEPRQEKLNAPAA